MAVVLRKLSQKRHWDDMEWLEQGDTQADKEGDTPDPGVNQWHIDLVELSIAKIARFAGAIKTQARIKRFNDKEVAQAIGQSVTSNFISKKNVSKEMAQSLRKRNVSLPLP